MPITPVAQASYSGGQALPAVGSAAYAGAQALAASAGGGSSAPAGTLYNASTGITATPNAGTTAAQQSAAVQAGFAPIGSSTLSPTAPITLPAAPVSSATASLTAGGNAALAPVLASLGYTYNSETGQYTYAPQTDTSESSTLQNLTATKIAAILGTPTPPSEASIYNSLPEKATVDADTQTVSDLTAQLNGLNAQQQSDLLSVRSDESQNGGTEATYGGAAAEINREYAIKILPVQAQLQAAQGNLQTAQTQLDTVFQLSKEDAQNTYTYQTGIINAVLGVADDEETQILNDQKTALATNSSKTTDAVNNAQSLSRDLMTNGQAPLAAQLSQLAPPDPNSATFTQDLANYNSQVATIQGQYVPKTTAAASTAVVNGAVNAGMNTADFAALPSDVQDFFSKSSDTQIAPFQTNLQAVAAGTQTLDDFNKWLATQNVSPAVSAQFKSWATTAAASAPAASSSVVWWNPTTWF